MEIERLSYAATYSRSAPGVRRPVGDQTVAATTIDDDTAEDRAADDFNTEAPSDDDSTESDTDGSGSLASRKNVQTPPQVPATTGSLRRRLGSDGSSRSVGSPLHHKPAPPLASMLRSGTAMAGQPPPPSRRPHMTVVAGADGEQTVVGGFSPLNAAAAATSSASSSAASTSVVGLGGSTAAKHPSPILSGAKVSAGGQGRKSWHSKLLGHSPGSGAGSVRLLTSEAPQLTPTSRGGSEGLSFDTGDGAPLLSIGGPAIAPARQPSASLSMSVAAAAAAVATGGNVSSLGGGIRPLPPPGVGIRAGDPAQPDTTHLTTLPIPPAWRQLLDRTASALANAEGSQSLPSNVPTTAMQLGRDSEVPRAVSEAPRSRARTLFADHDAARRIPVEAFEQVSARAWGLRSSRCGPDVLVVLTRHTAWLFGGLREALGCTLDAQGYAHSGQPKEAAF